jgi:HK97 family phage portal protein
VSIRERLANWIAPRNAVPLPMITRDSATWSEFFGAPNAVPAPNEKTALTVSAIYACVALISGAVAMMPMRIYRRSEQGEREELPSDPLWWTLNEEFCPRWQAATGWEFLTASLLLHGDAFAQILRGPRGEVVGLVPIHPNRVTVAPYPDGSRLVYAIDPDPTIPTGQPTKAERLVIDQDDVLHVPGFGFDGCRGLSALRYHLSLTGGVALATQDFSARFFANQARPDYALVFPAGTAPSQGAIDAIRAAVLERHQGTAKAHLPMVLHGGVDLKTITMPLADMQLLDVRRFQIEEIARVFGVPAFMIGHTEKTTSWGTGVDAMGTNFVRYALSRHLVKFHNEINRKFFRKASKNAEFDTFELERADMKSLFEAFRTALGRAGEPGFMTTNEVRRLINLKTKPDGDTLATGTAPDAPAPTV